MRRLVAYSWPGNVRELQNIAAAHQRAGRRCDRGARTCPPRSCAPQRGRCAPGSLRQAEDDAVRQALEAARGNKAEAARILGVDRKTLYAKLRRLEGVGAAA